MTAKEFEEKMKQIQEQFGGDAEMSHARMDDLMCGVLRTLGYGDGVNVFINSLRWYA